MDDLVECNLGMVYPPQSANHAAQGGWRRRHLGLLLVGLLVAIVGVQCTSLSTTTKCSTLPACATSGSKRFGQAVLIPQSATFVDGAINKGVLGIELRDGPTGRAYSMLVGKPGKGKPSCPGTVVDLSPVKHFCYGRSTAAVVAQFSSGKLLYTVEIGQPQGEAADQDLATRIVSTLQ